MFRLDHKVIKNSVISIALLFGVSLQADLNTGASKTYANGKRVIDGGVTYPAKNGRTGPYLLNTQKVVYLHTAYHSRKYYPSLTCFH